MAVKHWNCWKKVARDPSTSIDLVLMDMMMPEMDGLTATRAIRKTPRVEKAAGNHADREGHARRSGTLPGGRRE